MADAGPLVLCASKQPRKRKAGEQNWTDEKKEKFLQALADTCNVAAASRAAGVGASKHVYRIRARDAAFRAAWDQAIGEAYARLEMELLKRALHGVEETVVLRSGETRTMRKYSDSVALTLLRMHRETAALAGEAVDDGEAEAARARIVERLARIREKVEAERPSIRGCAATQDERIESKGRVDRVGLIAWGLRVRRPTPPPSNLRSMVPLPVPGRI